MTDVGRAATPLDGIGTALAAISIGAASGGAVVSLVLALAHGMARGVDQPFTWIALGGAVASVAVAASIAWAISRRLGPWHALLICCSAIAGCLLVVALTLPVDMVAGRAGLFGLGALCLVVIGGARKVFFGPGPA